MNQRDVWDSEEFYDLMQRYRWAGDAVPAFESVKAYCREVVSDVIACATSDMPSCTHQPRPWMGDCPACTSSATAEIERLRGALEKYGFHTRDCGMWPDGDPCGGPCSCGLVTADSSWSCPTCGKESKGLTYACRCND